VWWDFNNFVVNLQLNLTVKGFFLFCQHLQSYAQESSGKFLRHFVVIFAACLQGVKMLPNMLVRSAICGEFLIDSTLQRVNFITGVLDGERSIKAGENPRTIRTSINY